MFITIIINGILSNGRLWPFESCMTAISRKVVGKTVHATIPKGRGLWSPGTRISLTTLLCHMSSPQLSRQNQKPHGKTKNLTAKPKTSRPNQKTSWQKENTSRQNQKPHGKNKIPHGKTKNLTAKPNTSQRKQNSFGFAVGICFCSEVFGFSCEVFGFAVRYFVLILP